MRDVDYSKAWDQYHKLKHNDDVADQTPKKRRQNALQENTAKINERRFVQPATMIKKVILDDIKARTPKFNDGKEWKRRRHQCASKIYGNYPRCSSMSYRSRGNQKTNAKPEKREYFTHITRSSEEPEPEPKYVSIESDGTINEKSDAASSEANVFASPNDVGMDAKYRQEAKRLARLKQKKDRLRGQFLHFDIPDGLDDTVARFIMAVTLRCSFENPSDSFLRGSFEFNYLKKEDRQKCMLYAESLRVCTKKDSFLYDRYYPLSICFQFCPAWECLENFFFFLIRC